MKKHDASTETLYTKNYKEDLREGGVLYDIDNFTIGVYERLKAHVNKYGEVKPAGRNTYTNLQLQAITNCNYRQLRKSLTVLESNQKIKTLGSGVIILCDYHYNEEVRFKYKRPYAREGVKKSLKIPN